MDDKDHPEGGGDDAGGVAEREVPSLPGLSDVLRWSTALTGEVAHLPGTVRRARRVVSVLPEHLEMLIGALDRFSDVLDRSLVEVRDEVRDVGGRLEQLQESIDALAVQLGATTGGIDAAMPTLADAVLRLEHRLEGMDELLAELGDTVVGTIKAVPGLRRVNRRSGRSDQPVPTTVAGSTEPDGP